MPHGSSATGSVAESTTTSAAVPEGGRAVLRLVDHCAAKVVRVEDTVTTGNGSGVVSARERSPLMSRVFQLRAVLEGL